MKRAVIYARFSTDKQNEKSIDDQVALCKLICEQSRYQVVRVYEDRAVSAASTFNRLGWQALMRDARRKEFDVVVAEDIDRIARDEEDFHSARKRLDFEKISIHIISGVVGRLEGSMRAMMGAMYLQNLADKTRRGQGGAVRRGRHMGGRSYGYRALPAAPTADGDPSDRGKLEIVPHEAAIVRRIFADYLDGKSPRKIAIELNAEGVAGPRGNVWHMSTIAGSRVRQNGILENSLYVGKIVWGRQSFKKDPYTGKRVSRASDPKDIVTQDAPELRIIDDATWQAVRTSRAKRTVDMAQRFYARTLLSGLIKCGCCGSTYTRAGGDPGRQVLQCAGMRYTGRCDNRRTILRDEIEGRVVAAIKAQLMEPTEIAKFIEAFNRRWRELKEEEAGRRGALEREQRDIEGRIERGTKLLLSGVPARQLKKELIELEAERTRVLATIDGLEAPSYELHPKVGELCRRRIAELDAAIAPTADETARSRAISAIRELIEKIVIIPHGAREPYELEVHGRLAGLLRANEPSVHEIPLAREGGLVAGAPSGLHLKPPTMIIRLLSK